MFKILNTALSRKLEITNCPGRLVAKKNGVFYFEIDKENKVLKLKCAEGTFIKHFKTDNKIDNTFSPEHPIIDKEYQDLMKFFT